MMKFPEKRKVKSRGPKKVIYEFGGISNCKNINFTKTD